MIVIKDAQLSVFSLATSNAFLERLCITMKEHFGNEASEYVLKNFRELVTVGIDLAKTRGLQTECGIAMYVGLVLEFGADFEVGLTERFGAMAQQNEDESCDEWIKRTTELGIRCARLRSMSESLPEVANANA